MRVRDRHGQSHMRCYWTFEELALCYDEGVAWVSVVSVWKTTR